MRSAVTPSAKPSGVWTAVGLSITLRQRRRDQTECEHPNVEIGEDLHDLNYQTGERDQNQWSWCNQDER